MKDINIKMKFCIIIFVFTLILGVFMSIFVYAVETIVPKGNKYSLCQDGAVDRKYIKGIKAGENIENILTGISLTNGNECIILNKENTQVKNTDKVYTGMKLKTSEKEYILIVYGDLNGDGKYTSLDLSRVKLISINLLKDCSDIELQAADLKHADNNKITALDVSRMQMLIVGVPFEFRLHEPRIADLNEITINIKPEEEKVKEVEVTVIWPDNIEKFKKQISKDGGKTFIDDINEIKIAENVEVIARLIDEDGKVVKEAKRKITNVDILLPKIFTPIVKEVTKNSIKVEASTQDADATTISTKSGISEYTYYLKDSTGKTVKQEIKTVTNETEKTEVIFTELEVNAIYVILVEAKDKAGNIRKSDEITVKAEDYKITGELEINVSTEEPAKEVEIIVTWPTYDSELIKQISIDGGKTFVDDIDKVIITGNGKIIVRLIDETGRVIKEEQKEINNIDTLQPRAFIPIVKEVNQNSITVEAKTEDDEATAVSAKTGVSEYTYYLKDSIGKIVKQEIKTVTNETEKTEVIFTGLEVNTTYVIYVEAKDKAGNIRKSSEITRKIEDYEVIGEMGINVSTTNPSKTVKVTVTWPTYDSELIKQISTDGGTNYTNNINEVTVNKNGKIVARLVDGKGRVVKENSKDITNIDIIAPKTFTPIIKEVTKNSIKVEASTQDGDATTTSAKSGVVSYTYYLKDSIGKIVKQEIKTVTNETEKTEVIFTGLEVNTTYVIYVEAKDKVGNIRKSSEITRKTEDYEVIGEIGINVSTTDSSKTVKVTVTWPTYDSELIKQISTDGGTNYTNNINEVTVNKNGKIVARLVDGKGRVVKENSKDITNIDTIAPKTFTPIIKEVTNNSIRIEAKTEDERATEESSSSGIKEYIYYLKTQSGVLVKQETKQPTTSISTTQVTFTGLEVNTTYVIYVEAKDKAGNIRKSNELIIDNREIAQKTVKRIINYVYENGTTASQSVVDEVTFKQIAVTNQNTGQVLYQEWTPSEVTFNAVTSPTISRYTPNKNSISAVKVTFTSSNIIETVTYQGIYSGSVEFYLLSSRTGRGVSGVTFGIYEMSNEEPLLSIATSDSNGYVALDNLAPGDYWLDTIGNVPGKSTAPYMSGWVPPGGFWWLVEASNNGGRIVGLRANGVAINGGGNDTILYYDD